MRDFGKLYTLMQKAHRTSARNNDNLSSRFVKEMSAVGKSYIESISAAILSLGGIHAPIADARQIIYHTQYDAIKLALKDKLIIPGFGNSFYKDSIDPAWEDFSKELESEWKEYADRIVMIFKMISEYKGCKLFPNPAAFTAAVAEILDMAPGTEASLLISARIPTWSQQWAEYQK